MPQQQSPWGQPQPRGMLGRLAYPSSSAGTQLQSIGLPSREFDQMAPQMGFGMSGGFLRQPGPMPSLQPMAMPGTPPPIMGGNMRGQQDFTKPDMKAVGSMQALPQMVPSGAVQMPKEPSMWDTAGERIGQIEPQTWFDMAGAFLNAGSGDATVGDAFSQVGRAFEGQQQRALRKEEADYTRSRREREKVMDTRQDAAYTATQQELLDAKAAKEAALADPSLTPAEKAELQATPLSSIAETLANRRREATEQDRWTEQRTTLTAAQQAEIEQQTAALAAEQSYRNRALDLDERRVVMAESEMRSKGRAGTAGAVQQATFSMDLARQALTKLQNNPGLAGRSGSVQQWLQSPEAMALQADLDQLVNSATLDRIMEMKNSGVSMGPLTDSDILMLRNATINLDIRQGPQVLAQKLQQYYAAQERAVQALTMAGQPAQRSRFTLGQGRDDVSRFAPGASTGTPRVSSPAQAAALPSGTRFIDENGVERIRR